jgi:hypothetical protein
MITLMHSEISSNASSKSGARPRAMQKLHYYIGFLFNHPTKVSSTYIKKGRTPPVQEMPRKRF